MSSEMTGHTPGPWTLVDRETLEDGSVYPAHLIGGPHSLVVTPLETDFAAEHAAKGSNLFQWNERNEADARMIAAAPEMLEALEKIEALGRDGEHSGDRHARCRDIARSAIRKALNPSDTEVGG